MGSPASHSADLGQVRLRAEGARTGFVSFVPLMPLRFAERISKKFDLPVVCCSNSVLYTLTEGQMVELGSYDPDLIVRNVGWCLTYVPNSWTEALAE